MSLVDGDEPVETLAAHRTDQSFTEGVRLRRPHRRLEHVPAHRHDRSVHAGRIDAVPIVEDEPVDVSGVITMRNCWMVHSAVGCSVTFQWTIRRVPTSRTTKT